MVVLFSSLALKMWGFINLRVGNISEHNKKTSTDCRAKHLHS